MSKIIYLGNNSPVQYEGHKFGDDSIQTEDQPKFESVTTIHVSPDSTIMQSLAEIQEIWSIHSHDIDPSYIGYNQESKSLAIILSSVYHDIEIREITE